MLGTEHKLTGNQLLQDVPGYSPPSSYGNQLWEFADLADNAEEAKINLLQLQERYELLDL